MSHDYDPTNLAALRNEIDQLDEQLVALFSQRMNLSAAIADYKRSHDLPVVDTARERDLLTHISELAGPKLADYARVLYTTILSTSKSYQHTRIGGESTLVSTVTRALSDTPALFPEQAAVVCQGVEGAYAQLAASRLFALPQIRYVSDFEDVFRTVESGKARYGVLPLENSTAGSVTKVYDLMAQHRFYIVRSVRLKVDHALLAREGVTRGDIREIVSHEQAIRQCSDFLKTLPGIKITPCANTAEAARLVAQSPRTDLAALASRDCATLYGLQTLDAAVQDRGNNYTRFICIAPQPEIYPGADRTSLMLVTPHRPGALFQVLSRFYAHGINLTKLESRPVADRDFEFMFYFDLETSIYSERLSELLAELEAQNDEFRYLGSYSEIT